MTLSNISLRSLTALTALAVVACFVLFYLAFKYFWSFDRELEHARQLQQAETTRVQTIIALEKQEMGASMADYAAWNDLAEYIADPDPEFIEDSIGIHAFQSKALDGIFIFTPDEQLVWGMKYDFEQRKVGDYQSFLPYFPIILSEPKRASRDYVEAKVRFVVVGQEPFLAATSRVCTSEGTACDKGYLIFVKKVRSQFANVIELATGIDIDVLSRAPYAEMPKAQPNVSYLEKLDFSGNSSVVIKLTHQVKLPTFIRNDEIVALMAFSVLMYFINLLVVDSLVRPITNANRVLERFKSKGGKIPDESFFVSREMKAFARTINQIFNELDKSREELRWQSEHDPLTRISNRRKLERELTSFICEQRYPWVLLYLIDVDYFKLYNDRYGHLQGDNALKQIAHALEKIPFDGAKVVARFGGEEFCVVFASDTELEPGHFAHQMLNQVAALAIEHEASPVKGHLSISIGGVRIFEPNRDQYQVLFHEADQALYQAKDHGRSQSVVKDIR
ncbi:sensor domain-containing diguanylate cyclase [Vibrio sp. Vf1514]|uniref:sensor domain-containing diguanylate cyclase n=1 Tax=Vibrio sp. Vf1514 TaxID=3437381 RepID=UPI003F8A5320